MRLTGDEERLRRAWYGNKDVQHLLINQMSSNLDGRLAVREMVFLDKHNSGDMRDATRRLMLGHRDFMEKNMERFEFYGRSYNLYRSLAFYDHLPLASWVIKERTQQHLRWFGDPQTGTRGDAQGHVMHYEFTLDLDGDAEDLGLVINEAIYLAKLFNQWRVPYYLNFSGNKGFHVTVPVRFFLRDLQGFDGKTAPEMCVTMAEALKDRFGMSCIDTGIYDYGRLMKMVWSLDKDGKIVLPLRWQELEGFDMDMVRVEKYLSESHYVKARGCCFNNIDGDVKTLTTELLK